MRTKQQQLSPILKYSLPALGGLLLFVAAAAGTLAPSVQAQGSDVQTSDAQTSDAQTSDAQTANAQTSTIVIPLDPAVREAAGAPDMDCAYYRLNGKDPIPHPGTCGVSPGSSRTYICTANPDKNSSQQPVSQLQQACEWKVARYIDWQASMEYRAVLKSQPGNTSFRPLTSPDNEFKAVPKSQLENTSFRPLTFSIKQFKAFPKSQPGDAPLPPITTPNK